MSLNISMAITIGAFLGLDLPGDQHEYFAVTTTTTIGAMRCNISNTFESGGCSLDSCKIANDNLKRSILLINYRHKEEAARIK